MINEKEIMLSNIFSILDQNINNSKLIDKEIS